MARIGKQIPHFEEIDLSDIKAEFSKCKKYRYLLKLNYKKSLLTNSKNKTVSVILKNPSSADEKKSDITIRKVETYVYKHFHEVSALNILNIFAIRATDVKEVNKLFKENGKEYITGEDNNFWIKDTIKNSDILICAWGNNNGINKSVYTQRVSEIDNIIKESGTEAFKVVRPGNSKQPLHGLMWSFNYKMEKY